MGIRLDFTEFLRILLVLIFPLVCTEFSVLLYCSFQYKTIEDRDFNFHKVWLEHIISSLDLIGNQKTRLAFWIIDNLDKENKLTMTYRQIAEKSGISLDTVRVTMKSLMDSNFLERINQGAYRVNPDVVFKGTRSGRLNVLYQYNETKREDGAE